MFTMEEIKKVVEENKEEALQCLVEAIQSPSPTGSELPMAKTMLKWLAKTGLSVQTYEYQKDRPNIIASWKGSQDGKKFLFNGHMDVFPPSETTDETYNPWSGEIKDGKVFGRGSSDMKGGDCAALMAVMLLRKMGFDPKGTITINYVSDEETGGQYGVLSLLDQGLLEGDFGISMEPSEMDLYLGHGSIYPCQVIVYGDGGPACVPLKPHETQYGGEDAITKAMKAVAALQKLEAEVISQKPATVFGQSHLAVTRINAGLATNNYARRAEIVMDRRFMPNETPEEVDAEIIAAMEEIKKTDPHFAYEFHSHYEPVTPILQLEEDSSIVKAIDAANEALLGKKPVHTYTMAGDDAAHISAAIGTKMARFGPGSDELVATKDEYVLVENYLNCIAIYMHTLVALLS